MANDIRAKNKHSLFQKITQKLYILLLKSLKHSFDYDSEIEIANIRWNNYQAFGTNLNVYNGRHDKEKGCIFENNIVIWFDYDCMEFKCCEHCNSVWNKQLLH